MGKIRTKNSIICALCVLMIIMYFIGIISINFSGVSFYYVTDMYTDMVYAAEAWEHKSIFPDGWVFGNQLYAIASPVLAAVFYGLTNDHCVSMGLASTLMGIFVLASFSWMLKPVLAELHKRLIASLALMTLTLAMGDPFLELNGWQLFFTMCSYYACYLIAAFMGFGCYIRSSSPSRYGFSAALIISCALSFGAGIQSLRQTAVMICPLLAVEFIRIIHRYVKKEKVINKSTFTVLALTASNLLGLLYAKLVNVQQVQIFEQYRFKSFSEIISSIIPSISNAFSLLSSTDKTKAFIYFLIIVGLTLFLAYKLHKKKNYSALILLSLFAVSISALILLNILTTMSMRSIYYFMLYPTAALLIAYFFAYSARPLRYACLVLLLAISLLSYSSKLSYWILHPYQNDSLKEVCEYLEENDIDTIFTSWNRGEWIAIESDFKIKAGFWGSYYDPMICVEYLCNPEIFDSPPSKSAYLFYSDEELAMAQKNAESVNAKLSLINFFPESNIYVCTSSQNIMRLYSEANKK